MAASDHLSRYAEGWTKGDANIIVGSLDDSYHMDDPNSGIIPKAGFAEYLATFKGQVDSIRPHIIKTLSIHNSCVMGSDSGLSPAERQMIATVVSALNRCQY